jgi:hypothetical protein
MADCNAFVGEWKIKTVTHYDEIVEHVISIRQDGHKYAVRCESHGRDYAKATCIDGVLRGDDGYEIRLKPGAPAGIELKERADNDNQAGSWTANDNSGGDSGS